MLKLHQIIKSVRRPQVYFQQEKKKKKIQYTVIRETLFKQ